MNEIPSFNSYIEGTIKDNWLLDALTDYKGATLQYHDVARKIEKLHIMMDGGCRYPERRQSSRMRP